MTSFLYLPLLQNNAADERSARAEEDEEDDDEEESRGEDDAGAVDPTDSSGSNVTLLTPAERAAMVDEWRPLSDGLLRSFHDAMGMKQLIAQQRQRPRSARSAQTPSGLVVHNPTLDVTSLMPFTWMASDSPVYFHSAVLRPYLGVDTNVVAGRSGRATAHGPTVDPRPFAAVSTEHLGNTIDYRAHAINPDSVLDRVTTLAYAARVNGVQVIHASQCDPKFYTSDQGAGDNLPVLVESDDEEDGVIDLYNALDGADMGMNSSIGDPLGSTPRAVRDLQGEMSALDAMVRDLDSDDDDDDDERRAQRAGRRIDGTYDALTAAFFSAEAAAEIDSDVIARVMRDLGEATPRPRFPFPGNAYIMSPNAIMPEIMATLGLPHVIDSVLHTDGVPPVEDDVLSRWVATAGVAHVVEQYVGSQRANAADTAFPTPALAPGVMDDIRTKFRSYVQELEEMSPEQLSNTHNNVVTHHRAVVTQAMTALATDASIGRFALLLVDHRGTPSTSNVMGTSDFAATRDMRVYQRTASRDTFIRQSILASAAGMGDTDGGARAGLEATEASEAMYQAVNQALDTLDPVFVERDDLLKLRLRNQASDAILTYKTNAELDGLAPDNTAERLRLRDDHVTRRYAARIAAAEALMKTLRTSDTIPESLASGAFRNFMEKHCGAQGVAATSGNGTDPGYDHKTVCVFYQEFKDMATMVHKISPHNMDTFFVLFIAALDCMTYGPKRSEPGMNVILPGATGVGKSYAINALLQTLAPGTFMKLTNVTSNAFNTSTSFDSVLLVMEEMKSSFIFLSEKDAREKGSSDDMNFLKERLTSFQSTTKSYHCDDKTGLRTAVSNTSSHHNTMIGATNQNVANIDLAVARRNLIRAMPEKVVTSRNGVVESSAFSEFRQSPGHTTILTRWRIIHAMYTVLRQMIKAEVMPEINVAAGRFILERVLAESGRMRNIDVSGTTRLHYVMQFAANFQLLHTAWFVLYSPVAVDYYARPGAPPPFSARAIIDLACMQWVLTKDAVTVALSALDFQYAPRFADDMIRDMAIECMNLHDPSQWKFPDTPTGTGRNDPVTYDPNYLMMSGRTTMLMCESIGVKNKEFRFRPEDIHAQLIALSKLYVEVHPCRPTATNENGMPTAIEIDVNARPIPLQALVIEPVPGIAYKGQQMRIRVSIAYMAKRLGVDIHDGASMKVRLYPETQPVREAEFDMGRATDHVTSRASHSIFSNAIIRTFAHPVLEKSPFDYLFMEDPEARRRVFEYQTTHAPSPVHVRYTQNGTEYTERVDFSAATMQLEAPRDPNGAYLVYENNATSTPTATQFLSRFDTPAAASLETTGADGEIIRRTRTRNEKFSQCSGVYFDKYDLEYTVACDQLRTLCHPGLPVMAEIFDVPLEEARLIPLAFGPVNFHVNRHMLDRERRAARFSGELLDFPGCNIAAQVATAVSRARGRNNTARGAVNRDFIEFHTAIGDNVHGGIAFTLDRDAPVASPDNDVMDIDEDFFL